MYIQQGLRDDRCNRSSLATAKCVRIEKAKLRGPAERNQAEAGAELNAILVKLMVGIYTAQWTCRCAGVQPQLVSVWDPVAECKPCED